MSSSGGADGTHTFDHRGDLGRRRAARSASPASLALTIADVTTNAEINVERRSRPAGRQPQWSISPSPRPPVVDSSAKAIAKDEGATDGRCWRRRCRQHRQRHDHRLDRLGRHVRRRLRQAGERLARATATDTMTTYAEAGAEGAARLGRGDHPRRRDLLPDRHHERHDRRRRHRSRLTVSGTVTLTATQDASTTTTAKASAGGADVSVGLALGLAIVADTVSPRSPQRRPPAARSSLAANGSSENENEADASAKGGKAKSDDDSGKDVNGKADEQLKTSNDQRKDNTRQGRRHHVDAEGCDRRQGQGSGSTSVQVAGAVAINVVTTKSLAQDQRRAHDHVRRRREREDAPPRRSRTPPARARPSAPARVTASASVSRSTSPTSRTLRRSAPARRSPGPASTSKPR